MKIAISSAGTNLEAMVDPRFGRCQYFIYIDSETLQFEAVENPGLTASGGAGIATAQAIASRGVEVVITGNCGPNAYQVLSAAGIKVITGVSGKIKDAVQDFKTGKYQASSQPNVTDHFGMGRGMGGGGRGMGHGHGAGRSES
jgi:predicted Fe-Mo cluster-binding NifX family protein